MSNEALGMKINFMPYESKPITRMAMEIPENAGIVKVGESTYVFQDVTFKAYQPPVAGDYIVRLTEEDTYHVARDVFLERNIVTPAGAQ
jgi:hypothetical protein